MWRDGRPYVVEEIPALRCVSCDEVLVDRNTAEGLQVIARELPTGCKGTRRIEVPVISYTSGMNHRL
ncbi:hypothetical protein [Paracoccus benzoatiresistens]|uniref:hypothetical protein n=1 Tax=Paracoccus benzoatiresistens TaxID=2997341 RepID=UPI0035300D38